MLRQIYRFLSIVIISNFLFSAAAFSKTPVNTDKVSKTESNKPCETKNNKDQKPLEAKDQMDQKTEKDPMQYVTKYGVYFDDDVLNTYDQEKPVASPTPKPVIQKPNDDGMDYVTKYGVYFDKDVLDSYPDKKPVN